MALVEKNVSIPAEVESQVFGQFDTYARKIERTLNVTILSRDGETKVIGTESGTAGAKRVLEDLARLAGQGSGITEQNVNYALSLALEKQDGSITLRENEILGIVTPVHWWQLPLPTREYLKKLNLTAAGQPYTFIVATCGTTPGCVFSDAERILQEKNIRLNAGFSVKMPDTWTPAFDLSDPERVARKNADAEEIIDSVIAGIESRTEGNHMKRTLPHAVTCNPVVWPSARASAATCTASTWWRSAWTISTARTPISSSSPRATTSWHTLRGRGNANSKP